MAGAAIDWLKEPMGFISNAQDSENVALSLKDSEDVYVVPAFTGLGSPYWDGFARGTVFGLSRGTGPRHIVRATLESIAYQTRDVLELMAVSSGYPFTELRIPILGRVCQRNGRRIKSEYRACAHSAGHFRIHRLPNAGCAGINDRIQRISAHGT